MKTANFPSLENMFNLLFGVTNFGERQSLSLIISRAKRSLRPIGLMLLLLLLGEGVRAINYYTYASGNPDVLANWWTATNGTGSHPTGFTGTGDVFIIQNSNTMSVNPDWTVSNLTINTGATLNISSSPYCFLILQGNFTNHGNLTSSASSYILFSENANQNIDGFTTNGEVDMSKSGGTATFMGSVNGGTLKINGTGAILNLGTGLTHTFTGFWSNVAGTLEGGSSLLKIEGSATDAGGTFISGTGTVEWSGYNDQTVAAVTYHNLILSGSGIKTIQGAINVNSSLTVRAGTTLSTLPSNTIGLTNSPTSVILECGATSGSIISGMGTLYLGGDVTVNNLGVGNNGATIEVPIALGTERRIFSVANDGTSAADLMISGAISGSAGIAKEGAGTLILSAGTSNSFTGGLIISAGTVQLGQNNTIPPQPLTLDGGTFSTGSAAGYPETLTTLYLTKNSVLNLGTGNHSLHFAESNGLTWTGGKTLTITGWTGVAGTSGTAGKIFFGSATGSLTSAQLSQISFSGYPGTPLLLSTGELVPQPVVPILAVTGATGHGNSCIGSAAAPITYTITNSGSLTADGITVNSNNTEFAVSNLSSTTIAANGGTATYQVSFTPSGSGARSATITIASTTAGSNSPTSSLTGTGAAAPSITGQPSTATQTLCMGASATALSVVATGTDLTYQWCSNTSASTTGGTKVGTNISSYTPLTSTPGTLYYYCEVSNTCSSSDKSNVSGAVTIDPPTVAGSVSGEKTICSGSNSGLLTLTTHTGLVIRWESSVNPFNSWTTISPNVTTDTYTSGTLTETTRFRAVVQSGQCDEANSGAATVTVDPPTLAGSVNGEKTICRGSNSGLLTLSTHTGLVIRWESSVNPFNSWTTISPNVTTDTYTSGALTETTRFRAVVQSGQCAAANSGAATITVDPLTVAGSVSGEKTICSGSNSGLLTLGTITGNVLRWESSVNPFNSWTTISPNVTTDTYTSVALTETTRFRAVVQSGQCAAANSGAATITVNPVITPSVTITSSDADNKICNGTEVTLTAIPTNTGGGTVSYKWFYSGNEYDLLGSSWTTNKLKDGETVSCEITVIGGNCLTTTTAVSNEITFTVNQNAEAVISSTNDPVCTGGDASFYLLGTVNAVVTYSIDGGTTSKTVTLDVSGAATVTIPGVTSNTTLVLLRADNPETGCGMTLTQSATITIINHPELSKITNNSPICYDQDANFYLEGTPDAEVTYSFDGGSTVRTVRLKVGITTVTSMEASSNVILSLISICNTALNRTSTVTVNPLPKASISGTDNVCNVTLTAETNTSNPIFEWGKDGALIPGARSSTYVATQSGSYLMAVTDRITGCTSVSDAFDVTINPAPEVSIIRNNSPICPDQDANFYLEGTPGAEVTYSFDGGTTTRSVRLNGGGTATVTSMEASHDVTLSLISICYKALSSTSTVKVNPLPTALISGAHNACGSTTLTAVTNASSPTYQWGLGTQPIPDESSSTLVAKQTGSYRMLVTDGITGCSNASDPFEITILDNTPPSISEIIANPTTVCTGGTSTLTVNGTLGGADAWKWYSGSCGGTLVGTGPSITVSPAENTTYYVRGEGGCATPGGNCGDVTITLIPSITPSVTIVSSASDNKICYGTEVTFTATPVNTGGGTVSYQWKYNNEPIGYEQNTFISDKLLDGDKVRCEITLIGGACLTSETATSNEITMSVEAIPVAGTFSETPDVAAVCEGTAVSAALTAGTGGNGTDELQFRTKDGTGWSEWAAYASGTDISTTGKTRVEIQTKRLASFCSSSDYNTVVWDVEATPVAGTFSKTPDVATVCEGTDVSAVLTPGSGGDVTDMLVFRTHDGTDWSIFEPYKSGTSIGTTGKMAIEIWTRRWGNYCNNSDENFISWAVEAIPVIDNPGPQTANGSYPLPAITGKNLVNPKYYDNSQASGGTVITGPITSSITVWIFDTTPSGCTDEESFLITINALPAPPVVGTITQPTCAVPSGSVVLSGLPSGSWTVTRMPGSVSTTGNTASAIIGGLPPGNTYTFTVTNSAGGTSLPSGNVVINLLALPPAPVIGNITQPTCTSATGSVALSGLPSPGDWTVTGTGSTGNVTKTGKKSSENITGLSAGTTYTFTVTNSAGCTSLPSVDVVIIQQPLTPGAPAVGSQSFCDPATVDNLPQGNGSNTYNWYRESTKGEPLSGKTKLNTGNYYVSQVSGGCESSRSLVRVTINDLPKAYKVSGGGTYCAGSSGLTVKLSDSDLGINYQLYLNGSLVTGAFIPGTGSAISFINQILEGTYTIKAVNATTGCGADMNDKAVITIGEVPTASAIGYDKSSSANCKNSGSATIVLFSGSPGGKYTSAPAGLSINSSTGAINFSKSDPGIYTVTYTVSNTCGTAKTMATVTVTKCTTKDAVVSANGEEVQITIPEADKIKVFPNPTQGYVTFEFSTMLDGKVTIDLFNMQGKLICNIFTGDVKAGEQRSVIFNKALPAGNYIYRMNTVDGVTTGKLIIMQ